MAILCERRFLYQRGKSGRWEPCRGEVGEKTGGIELRGKSMIEFAALRRPKAVKKPGRRLTFRNRQKKMGDYRDICFRSKKKEK